MVATQHAAGPGRPLRPSTTPLWSEAGGGLPCGRVFGRHLADDLARHAPRDAFGRYRCGGAPGWSPTQGRSTWRDPGDAVTGALIVGLPVSATTLEARSVPAGSSSVRVPADGLRVRNLRLGDDCSVRANVQPARPSPTDGATARRRGAGGPADDQSDATAAVRTGLSRRRRERAPWRRRR
jgi:hypothetical protein